MEKNKKNFTIAIPKMKDLIIPPINKNIKLNQKLISIRMKRGPSKVSLYIPSNFGVLEQDLIYIYLLQILKNNNNIGNESNQKHKYFMDEKNLLKKSKIQIKTQEILKLLNKSSGGSNYKQIYKSHVKLAQSVITWEFYNLQDKVLMGASNLIDFNIDKNKIITTKVSEFYVYYLLQQYRNNLIQIIDKYLLKYTLINLKERFSLKNEIDRYIHEWLSHNIFPNNGIYTVQSEKILEHIKYIRNNNEITSERWYRNTRQHINKSIVQVCNKLENWTLVNICGRGNKKVYQIKRNNI